jgi:hypothetical protein
LKPGATESTKIVISAAIVWVIVPSQLSNSSYRCARIARWSSLIPVPTAPKETGLTWRTSCLRRSWFIWYSMNYVRVGECRWSYREVGVQVTAWWRCVSAEATRVLAWSRDYIHPYQVKLAGSRDCNTIAASITSLLRLIIKSQWFVPVIKNLIIIIRFYF